MMDEGYIKFNAEWEKSNHVGDSDIESLNLWRQKLYNVNLLGVYPDGIGFGNVSQRSEGNKFYISGSKTGSVSNLSASDYAEVIDYKIQKNWVKCIGETIASSESMSHAIIYEHNPHINAVFHVHHLELWQKLLHKIPTTPESAPYGSPEMANEILQLFSSTHVADSKLFAMAGHREGLFSFGATLEEAGNVLLDLMK
ncbi:MAG: class II aldolase/adducin family protein [Saprospiraceae bacterium]|nr:class II aldolase/adducin family protein [Saprospiraceae bacterium]